MIDQKWSPREIPTIAANVTTRLTAGTRITTLYRRPRAMPARALITANSMSKLEYPRIRNLCDAERRPSRRWQSDQMPFVIAGTRACPQLGDIFTRTDQNQTRNAVL